MVSEMNKDFIMGGVPPDGLEPVEGPSEITDLDKMRGNILSARGHEEPTEEATEPEEAPSETEEVVEEVPAPEPEAEIQKEQPPWLQDEPPEKKVDLIKWKLMHGMTEQECIESGDNSGSVRICAQELERDGYRKRPPKLKGGRDFKIIKGQPTAIRTFAAGSPPEALANAISIGLDGDAKLYETGMKDGMKLVIMGVRIAQELSNIGVQQVKPLIDMTKTFREGEALAAKNAAIEAASEAAQRVSEVFGPTLAGLQKAPEGADPMRAILARAIEPVVQNMVRMFMPGGQNLPQSSGWKVEKG